MSRTVKAGERLRRGGLLTVGIAALALLLWVGPACGLDKPPSDAGATATPLESSAGGSVPTTAPTTATTALEPSSEAGTTAARPPAGASAASADAPADAMTAADFPTPPERDLPLLARQLRRIDADTTPTYNPDTTARQVGDTRDFWVLDYPNLTMRRNSFRLAAVSDSAYWWLEDGARASADDVRRTVQEAEARVFPRVTAVFADAPEPETAQRRRHVVSGHIPGIGGYVSGGDLHPDEVSLYSNEADAIYINTRAARYGDDAFLHILAHELQHSIHQQADESEATWLNEGLAELAVKEAGYPVSSIDYYLRRPDASLVNWPIALDGDVGLNYGAAALFAHYLREHHAPHGGLQDLLALDADGIAAVDAFLAGRSAQTADGQPADFHAVFAHWMPANLLDWQSPPYGYDGLDVSASITRRQKSDDDDVAAELAQYAIDYVELTDADDVTTLHFEGDAITPLLPVEAPGQCWWSNRGDTISATLTLPLTVPAAASDGSAPTLTYRYWHDIEENWDYLYVTASTDAGATWDVLPADGTTDANPVGNGYGFGYTGASDGWQDGTASLADYAGRNALLRFHYVTDDAIHGPGFCVQNLRVSGGDGSMNGDNTADWQPDGFVQVNNRVRQDWIVWVIADAPPDAGGTAKRMQLDWDAASGRYTGSMPAPDTSAGRLVVAVAATAPATMEPAQYRVWAQK